MAQPRRHHEQPLILCVLALANYLLLYLVGVVLARVLGAEGFQDYSVAVATLAILATLATLGLEKFALQALPTFVARHDWRHTRGFLMLGVSVAALAGLALAVMMWLGAWLIPRLIGGERHAPTNLAVAFLPCIAVGLFLIETITAYNAALRAMLIYRIALPIVILVLIVLASASLAERFTTMEAILCYGAAWSLCLLVAARYAYAAVPAETWQTRGKIVWSWVASSLPFMLISLLMTLLVNTGVLVLEAAHPREVEVAVFAAAAQTAGFVVLLATSTNRFYLPRLAFFLANGGEYDLRMLARRRLLLIGSTSAAFVALIALFGRDILRLFGDGFVAGYLPLCLLAVANAFSTTFAMAPYFLQFVGGHRLAVSSVSVAVALNLALCLALAKPYGALGVAIAYLTTTVSLYGFLRVMVTRRLRPS